MYFTVTGSMNRWRLCFKLWLHAEVFEAKYSTRHETAQGMVQLSAEGGEGFCFLAASAARLLVSYNKLLFIKVTVSQL